MDERAGQAAAIVLAAGSSTRLGRPKQLLELAGKALLARAVRAALEAGASPVWVIVSAPLIEAVRKALAGMNAVLVVNPDASEGMGSSLRVGMAALSAVEPIPERVLLMVCDQPLLSADHLRKLLNAASPHGIIAAAYAGRLGVPAIFRREHYAGLAASRGDSGARELLRKYPATAVDMPEAAVDIDTPEQLRALCEA